MGIRTGAGAGARIGIGIGAMQGHVRRACTQSLPLPAGYCERRAAADLSGHYRSFTKPPNYLSIREFVARHRDADTGTDAGTSVPVGASVSVAGRVERIRSAGDALHFVDVCQDGQRLQLILNQRSFRGPMEGVVASLQRGDIVSAEGRAGRSARGELSCRVEALRVLTPCLQNLPDGRVGIASAELRSTKRHLDLLANADSRARFVFRARLLGAVRAFLDARGFLEVETPVLGAQAGGAVARPFRAQRHAGSALHLRIAPELHLKQLVVGGLERVYELGRVFRDEGTDATHNPEFTICELYAAYADLRDMHATVQELLRATAALARAHNLPAPDLSAPFPAVDVVDALRREHGVAFDPGDPASLLHASVLAHVGPPDAPPPPPAKVFDRLVARYLEPACLQPTFLYRPPLFTSPLARADAHAPSLASRFELFYRGHELANAYDELTDPREQLRRFQQQAALARGDAEVPAADAAFIDALECGLPPTAGCGIGIDRLLMVLTQSHQIRDVILYPLRS